MPYPPHEHRSGNHQLLQLRSTDGSLAVAGSFPWRGKFALSSVSVTMWEISDTCSIPSVTVQPCNAYDLGFAVGQKFATMIISRLKRDPSMKSELIPFAASKKGQEVVNALIDTNRKQYPRYWEELQGMADGAQVPFIEVLLLNFRKEIAPFLPRAIAKLEVGKADQCSDVLLCSESEFFIAHNEDADVSVKDHVYLVQATLQSGLTFIAYTYAGELPSCAFGINDAGIYSECCSSSPRGSCRRRYWSKLHLS